MYRSLLSILIALAAGIAASLALAAALALWSPERSRWTDEYAVSAAPEQVTCFGFEARSVTTSGGMCGNAPKKIYYQCAAGWPLRCLFSVEGASFHEMPTVVPQWRPARLSEPIVFRRWYTPTSLERGIPLGVRWGSLAANSLLLSAVGWLVLAGPCRFRRWARARRAMCVNCGYDLAGLAAAASCPECGSAAPRASFPFSYHPSCPTPVHAAAGSSSGSSSCC